MALTPLGPKDRQPSPQQRRVQQLSDSLVAKESQLPGWPSGEEMGGNWGWKNLVISYDLVMKLLVIITFTFLLVIISEY